MKESLLKQAEEIIHGERNESYGPMRESFQRTADLWSIILEKKLAVKLSPEDVCLCMVGLKLSRELFKAKPDNIVDAMGYLEIYNQIGGY